MVGVSDGSHGATNGAPATLSRRRAPADTSMLSGRSAVESSDLSAQKDGVTASWPSRIGPLACGSCDRARRENLHLMLHYAI